MVSRESEPDDSRGPERPAPDGYPLLFKGGGSGGHTGALRRLLTRILGFFRSSPPDAAVSDERRVEPPPRAAGTRTAEPASPDAVEHTHGKGPGEPDAPLEDAPAPDDQRHGGDDAAGLEGETLELDGEALGIRSEGPPSEAGGAPSRDEGPRPDAEEAPSGGEADVGADAPPGRPLHRSTLQMLPGRLVPLDADTLPREIRFMKPANPRQEVTLGWEPGDPPDHVTLDHPSVPMRQAAMRYRRGHWWIESLSDEPAVVLNGRPLETRGGPRHLKDGDIVRLGDLDFRFRMP